MAQIINNTNILFSSDAQQVINNAAANHGVDTVLTGKNSTDGSNDTLFDLYDEKENYLFSLDLDDNVIFNKI